MTLKDLGYCVSNFGASTVGVQGLKGLQVFWLSSRVDRL